MRLADSLGMWKATFGLPEQMEAALANVGGICDFPSPDHIEHVVVTGMGGSGIAGDVAVASAAPFMAVPVTVVKGYELPSYVGANSLVIAVSFSGNTEETVEVVSRAVEHGARTIAVTTGGEVGRIVAEQGGCVVEVDSSIPQPRAAFGALSVSVLGILEKVGLFPGASQWVELAIEQVKARRAELDSPGQIAAEIAGRLEGALPLIVSSGALGAVAAMRWKAQINENVKGPAVFSVYPEGCHNELAGFDRYPDFLREEVAMVVLRHEHEHPQIGRRFAFLEENVGPRLKSFTTVRGQGVGELASLFDLVYIGDVMSLHLADLLGVDPGPIDLLDSMKKFLGGL